MILVIVDDPAMVPLLQRVLGGAAHRLGDIAPELRTATVATIANQTTPLATTPGAPTWPLLDDRPMTFAEVAAAAGCSKTTIARAVKAGQLERVGRRVTSRSVRSWLQGRQR